MKFVHSCSFVLLVVGLACAAAPTPAPSTPAPSTPTAASTPIEVSPAELCGPEIEGADALNQPLVLVGEIHGTQEIPATFASLVCHAAVRQGRARVLVGLEIPHRAQPLLDAYLASPGDDAAKRSLLDHEFWQREFQDGRSSAAMSTMIDRFRRMRAAGLEVLVVAIDDDAIDDASERDAAMAERLRGAIEQLTPGQTWFYAGNLHTRALPGYPWAPEDPFRSVAVHLRSSVPSLVSLNVALSGGEAWVCRSAEAEDCGPDELRSKSLDGVMPRVELESGAIERTGYSGKLVIGKASASFPAVAEK